MKLTVLGAPGAGKGTQAIYIAKRFNIKHISTGEILRTHMKNKTELGEKIRAIMDSGQLVPDEIVLDIVKKRIVEPDCKNGFILDGFPRTISQAKIFDEQIAAFDSAISFEIDDEVILERMAGRVVCSECGHMYHTSHNPPKVLNTCDLCGAALIQREDDKTQTVMRRLKIYHELTKPIIKYYEDKHILFRVDASLDIKEISEKIVKVLGVWGV